MKGLMVREKDLNKHLESSTAAGSSSGNEKSAADEKTAKMIAEDNQLRMAIQLVKSLPKIKSIK